MCFRYTVPTIHSNDTIHTIHTIPTLHSKHSIRIIVNHTYHTNHTYCHIKHTIPNRLTYHTYHPYSITPSPHHRGGGGQYHTPTAPQGGEGDSTTPPPHHRGGRGDSTMADPWPWPGGRGGLERWTIYTHTYTLVYFILLGQGSYRTHVVVSYRVAAWALLTRHGRHIKEAIDEQPPPAAAS